jgi:lysine-specific demethylase 3
VPRLYNEFAASVPLPEYVLVDGPYNIASYLSKRLPKLDLGETLSHRLRGKVYDTRVTLGPKMYNAHGTNTKKGSRGSTPLHMDASDAVNMLAYACETPQKSRGHAVWDIFKAGDSEAIRRCLRDKHPKLGADEDPIHLQQFYLDDDVIADLWQKFGVRSHRILQTPGQAVFIPAGCAHQVSPVGRIFSEAVSYIYIHTGCECCGLHQNCHRLRLAAEYQPMRAAEAGVPGHEFRAASLEGRHIAATLTAVVCMEVYFVYQGRAMTRASESCTRQIT